MASPAGRRVSVDSAASPAARPEIATPRVRTVSGESAASLCPPAKDAGSARSDTGASDSEEPLDDSAFHARHAVLEKAERKANKSVYCTAQYRQAVDRARQRQKEQEKALRSHRGAADAGERASDKRQQRGQDAGDGGGHRKRQRAGRGPSDADQDAKRAKRQELCRRYLYQQSTMTAEELEAARRAMVELRAEHNAAAARAQGASPRRTGSGGRPQAGKLSAERAAVKRGGASGGPDRPSPKAARNGAAPAVRTCKLMAKNIPQEIPIKAVRAHFSRFGEISNITLCFAQSNLGHAIITFTTPDAVERAARNSSSS